MAKKLEKIKALGRIDYNGGVYCPGTDQDAIECDPAEAKRLIALGVAVAVTEQKPLEKKPEPTQEELEQQAQADLLTKIAAAASEEELFALMPENEPTDAGFAEKLRLAAEARLDELRA